MGMRTSLCSLDVEACLLRSPNRWNQVTGVATCEEGYSQALGTLQSSASQVLICSELLMPAFAGAVYLACPTQKERNWPHLPKTRDVVCSR